MDQFFISCKICDKEVDLIVLGNDDYICPSCGAHYSAENGVVDRIMMEDMYQLYKGAKLAGFIRDELDEEPRSRLH